MGCLVEEKTRPTLHEENKQPGRYQTVERELEIFRKELKGSFKQEQKVNSWSNVFELKCFRLNVSK